MYGNKYVEILTFNRVEEEDIARTVWIFFPFQISNFRVVSFLNQMIIGRQIGSGELEK